MFLLFAVMQCPDGMIPVDNACACQPTCDNPSAESYCPWPNTEKCVCPNGKILFNGHCVQCCGCIDSSGVIHEVRMMTHQMGMLWNSQHVTNQKCTGHASDLPFKGCWKSLFIMRFLKHSMTVQKQNSRKCKSMHRSYSELESGAHTEVKYKRSYKMKMFGDVAIIPENYNKLFWCINKLYD